MINDWSTIDVDAALTFLVRCHVSMALKAMWIYHDYIDGLVAEWLTRVFLAPAAAGGRICHPTGARSSR